MQVMYRYHHIKKKKYGNLRKVNIYKFLFLFSEGKCIIVGEEYKLLAGGMRPNFSLKTVQKFALNIPAKVIT